MHIVHLDVTNIIELDGFLLAETKCARCGEVCDLEVIEFPKFEFLEVGRLLAHGD